MSYTGTDKQKFAVSVTPPTGWTATATTSAGKQAAVIELGPADSFPASEYLSVSLSPPATKSPDPGDYKVTLTVDSGAYKQSIDLTARVTARYGLSMMTDSGRLSTDATAGQDTHLSVNLSNTGTAPIQNISFSSTKPDGWTITFKPDKVDSLAAGYTQQVDVVMNPPGGKTVAGDYAINLSAQGAKGWSSLDIRVTVLTPSIWGWVGIIIVVAVIGGLVVLFRVLGRR